MRLTTLALTALLAGLLSGPAQADETATDTSFATDLERQVAILVNEVRNDSGCPALRTVPSLADSSARHSVLMARHDDLSHRLPGEESLLSRTAEAGFADAEIVGENIAVGFRSAPGVVAAWMRSPSHRAIILDCVYREIGVGTVATEGRRWWTMDVGRR